tara:strand:+ start:350 stop:556 length:207 start_codon:yes stop_codon:yes gene_type:complete
MCLGGGGGGGYQYKEPEKYMPPPGPDMGPDRVNDKIISDTGNYNRDNLKLGSTEAKPQSQSSKNRGLY